MPLITFRNDKIFHEDDVEQTLLDMALKHGVLHTHICGGRARCSTCRVIVEQGLENVDPRNEVEQKLADEKGLEDRVRLACQMRFHGDITVRRLVIDSEDIFLLKCQSAASLGREANIAILFSDIRAFTTFSENHLPYDVIHMLNRYFYDAGEAVLKHDGFIDKYMGDGLMALFGLKSDDPGSVCRNAVETGLAMLKSLGGLNTYLRQQFEVEFSIGIGIHYGQAIVGEMGHPSKRLFTAIGDVVNISSRIESATKIYQTPLLISEAVAEHVRETVPLGRTFEAELKGKSGMYRLYEVVP